MKIDYLNLTIILVYLILNPKKVFKILFKYEYGKIHYKFKISLVSFFFNFKYCISNVFCYKSKMLLTILY